MERTCRLLAMMLLLAAASLVACGGDDDDNDDNDGSSGDGLCYVQCEEGCLSTGACLSGFGDADSCDSWGEEHCNADGCDSVETVFVDTCDACSECPDAPAWWE